MTQSLLVGAVILFLALLYAGRGYWAWVSALAFCFGAWVRGGVATLTAFVAASSVATSVNAAIIVAVFAGGGLFITNWLFTSQRKNAAMAALPPIAMMAIIGYVVAILLGV